MGSSEQGITKITLAPPIDGEVWTLLEQDLTDYEQLRAAVAYWTIEPTDALAACLSGTGFLCVDIHLPTNIDALATLHNKGANVFLHLFSVSGQTEGPFSPSLPSHLMHSKMLLFDDNKGSARTWIGSHNWTRRALHGVNIETSTIIDMDLKAPLLSECETHLGQIKDRCKPFDPKLIDYYKWLQGDDGRGEAGEPVLTIGLTTKSDEPLSDTAITIFGTKGLTPKQLKSVDTRIFVIVTSLESEEERRYSATILHSGKLESSDVTAGGVSLEARRYAEFPNPEPGLRPLLLPKSGIPKDVFEKSYYFVTVKLQGECADTVLFSMPLPSKRWKKVTDDDRMAKLPKRQYSGKKGDKKPYFRGAVSAEGLINHPEDRRQPELFSRRILIDTSQR